MTELAADADGARGRGGERTAARAHGEPLSLAPVDETVLRELVDVAVHDADADEVTPRLDAESGWAPARVAWLRAYHRDRRSGMDGPLHEATWAVVGADSLVGSVRLQRTADAGVLEVGVWLARRARAQGWGRSAVRAVTARALDHGAVALRADTSAGNAPALAVLTRLGFACAAPDAHGRVTAVLALRAPG